MSNATVAPPPTKEDKASYEKEKERFIKEILQFHEAKGTPARRLPKINGYEVDLYLLYTLVTSRGGWVKVNNRNEWDQILDEFNIPQKCVNSDVAIKQIYLRYLDKYEKIHFHGELGNDEDESSRPRQFSAKTFHSIPMVYNHGQHNVNESLRVVNGLSTDMYSASEYDKLALSLISPLPNEQDFAVNVCTLLSNEGKHCLKLQKHPRILHFLLAHAAVFHDPSLRTLFQEIYGKSRGHSMTYLWRDIVTDENILKLSDESQYVDWDDGMEEDDSSNKGCLTLEPEDRDIFCLGRTLGVQDYVGQRVCQIAAILRNLTFVNENMLLMGKDLTFLRFIILCCYANWDSLHQMGWDMLCNVATEITERTPIMDQVLTLTHSGLLSEDRADILSALEVLTKLAQNELNEDLLIKNLKLDLYERVCSFLTLHDIMLLVCTLECLNALSALGERACNDILAVHGILDVLVSLVSVEAQSYGPKACIQMRVVETVRDLTASGTTAQQSSVTQGTSAPSPAVTSAQLTTSQVPGTLASAVTPVSHQTVVRTQQVSNTTPRATATPPPSQPSGSSFSGQATEQIAQENEKFALAWLRCTFELTGNGRIEQGELYKQYINYCAKIGRRGVIAPLHFPRIVRNVFGVTVGPKLLVNAEGNTQQVYEGLQVRLKPLVSSPIPSTNIVHATPSSILKAQLSAPPKPTPPTTPVKMQVSEGAQHSPQSSSSFMKTLLANKIAEHQKQQQLQQQQQQLQQLQQHLQQNSQHTLQQHQNIIQVVQKTQENQQQIQQSHIVIQQEPQIKEEVRDNPSPASITYDESSQSSTQEGITFKLNGMKSLMDILGSKPQQSSDGSTTTVIASGNIRQSPQLLSQISNITSASLMVDEASTSNSNSVKGETSEIGTEENSKSSIEGFLNTVSVISDNPAAKDIKVEIKRDQDAILPLTENIKIEKEDSNSGSSDGAKEATKRPHEKEEEVIAKKLNVNGEETEQVNEEVANVSASSSAANLYAALAADVLEDEPMEETPQNTVQVPQAQPTQILVTAGGQLAQVVGGQYVVPQGKALGPQDQKQTVLVAQTAQQQGTSAKTIIILQPQGGAVQNPQQVIRFQFPTQPSLVQTQQGSNVIRSIVPPKAPTVVTSAQDGSSKVVISNPQANVHVSQSAAAPLLTQQITSSQPSAQPVVVASHPQATTIPHLTQSTSSHVSVVTSSHTVSTIATQAGNRDIKLPTDQKQFLCEWRGCMKSFNSENEVYLHACEAHLPQGSEEVQCLWDRCDAMKRKRFSLMTHLYDKHCNPEEMKNAARRKHMVVAGKPEVTPTTSTSIPHPGYGPNAAYAAIKRHALDIVQNKDGTPQRVVKPGPTPVAAPPEQSSNEGPVTKSIRLTASLILRNLVVYSTSGRRQLMRYESFLACVALSNVESSRTIAHVLYDLCNSR